MNVAKPFLFFLATLTFAQAAPAPVRVRPIPPLPSKELGRKVEESIEAGDGYPTPAGWRSLRRAPGRVAVAAQATNAAFTRQWSDPGRPLAGYRMAAHAARRFAIFAAPETERQQQRGSPQLLEQVIRQARSGAARSPVNPVFIDPQNGLEVIATERLVVCLRPGTDAAHYFGPAWKQATPVWGTRHEFVLTLPQATAEQILAEVRRRAGDP
ncbi:MAG TPA: hypothetical protein VNH84_08140, partial [Candidatus Saccharimonadales bacterium]|nr:hypothetical protein [Candidatus Saccharimonadales bacterium]